MVGRTSLAKMCRYLSCLKVSFASRKNRFPLPPRPEKHPHTITPSVTRSLLQRYLCKNRDSPGTRLTHRAPIGGNKRNVDSSEKRQRLQSSSVQLRYFAQNLWEDILNKMENITNPIKLTGLPRPSFPHFFLKICTLACRQSSFG